MPKNKKVSTLIDVKVLPKTMTHGYGAWWRVGAAEVTKNKEIQKKRDKNIVPYLEAARKY